jgi:hypothetical protein
MRNYSKTINILNGDTLEGAQVGDHLINGYGEHGAIVGDLGTVWRVRMRKGKGRIALVFKYNKDSLVLTNQG